MSIKAYKQTLLEALYAPYKRCMQCPLGNQGRTHVVFGSGSADARLMFVGEGPGRDEDAQGEPFVGRSGQLLNKLFEAMGINREEVFISNIVKCRPPNNRKPTPIEMSVCKKLLLEKQIKIIRPRVLCTLGSSALEGLLDRPVKITAERGIAISYKNTPVIPTYHPAYVLRNPPALQHLAKDIQTAFEISQFDDQLPE